MSDQIKWQGLATAYAGPDDNFRCHHGPVSPRDGTQRGSRSERGPSVAFHSDMRVSSGDSRHDAVAQAAAPGYEFLLRGIGRVSHRDIERLADRFILAGDASNVLNARDSLTKLLGSRDQGA